MDEWFVIAALPAFFPSPKAKPFFLHLEISRETYRQELSTHEINEDRQLASKQNDTQWMLAGSDQRIRIQCNRALTGQLVRELYAIFGILHLHRSTQLRGRLSTSRREQPLILWRFEFQALGLALLRAVELLLDYPMLPAVFPLPTSPERDCSQSWEVCRR